MTRNLKHLTTASEHLDLLDTSDLTSRECAILDLALWEITRLVQLIGRRERDDARSHKRVGGRSGLRVVRHRH